MNNVDTLPKQEISPEIRRSITNTELLTKRREEIVLKSAKVFLKKGFDGTTVQELAKAMGMTVGGLYRYIGSKEDILRLILEYMDFQNKKITNHTDITDKLSPVEALKMGIETFYKLVDELKPFYNFLNHVMVNLSPENRKKIVHSELATIGLFERIIIRGLDSGVFNVEDPSYLAHLIVLTGHGWANRSWFLKGRYTIEQYITMNTHLFLKQIMAHK